MMVSVFPVFPVTDCLFNVRGLRALVAAAQQQHDTPSHQSLIHSIAGACVDSQFPDAIPAESVVAKIAQFET